MSLSDHLLETWKQPGRILLLSCYEQGHQPLGLAAPLGALRQRGFAPAARDLSLERLVPQQVEEARFIGLSVPMHTALRLAVRVASEARKLNPEAHLCFFGLYASLNAAFLLENGANSVIGGEFLEPLLDWIEALGTGSSNGVPGVQTTPEAVAPNLRRPSVHPLKRHDLPDLERYAKLERDGQRLLAGYVEATHGCLHQCLHCPITPVYQGRFVALDRQSVLQDIEAQVQAGARHITFGDPDFLNGPRHAMQLAQALHDRFPGLSFDITTKVEHIVRHADLFPELASLGCLFVISALESLSDTVLQRLHKGHTRADAHKALHILQNAGLQLHPTFVAFTPWTTLEDHLELFQFLNLHRLAPSVQPVQLALRLLIPPGSALLPTLQGAPWLGHLDEEAFTYRWSHPDPCMDRLQQDSWALVEQATQDREPPATTLHRLHALTRAAAGLEPPAEAPTFDDTDALPLARISEDWFC